MTIDDSVDDALPAAEFEEEEEEFDPQHPYQPIVQTLDLPLGTGVLHVSILQLSEAERDHYMPKLLRENLLVAVGCTDASIRVVTLPLDPPSHAHKKRESLRDTPSNATAGHGSWGEQVVVVPTAAGHRTLPTAVGVAVAPRSLVFESEDDEMDGYAIEHAWDLLVASTSADAGGTLLVHRIPFKSSTRGLKGDRLEVYRNVLLNGLPTRVDIYVGPDLTTPIYPMILVAEAGHGVSLFECGSAESKHEGRWIARMQPSAQTSSSLLCVRFGLAGRLAIALTSDGEWGVWDITEAQEAAKGDMTTLRKFTYGGTLTSPNGVVGPSTSRQAQFKALPAVTPHTRKIRQENLFTSDSHRSSGQAGSSPASRFHGGISLTKTTHESGAGEDSFALLWYNDRAVFVQSLRAHHTSRTVNGIDSSSALITSKDPFSGPTNPGGQIRAVNVVDRATLCGGTQVSAWPLLRTAHRAPSLRSKAPEVAYISERAISFVGPPLNGESDARSQTNGDAMRDRTAVAAGLLKHGELSLGGLEGMLDRMAGGAKRLSGRA